MTQDEMIDMAKQAWADAGEGWVVKEWFDDRAKALEAFAKLVAAKAIAELESQEPVAHCEAGPEFCQQCYKESLPTYGSEEVSKLREVIQSQAKIIADYEKQIDEPAIYPEEAYEMGLEAIAYYTHPPQRTEQNFCPRCGKRTNDIHTCTPPQRTWQGLTDEEIDYIYTGIEAVHDEVDSDVLCRAIEAKLKQKNGFAEEKNT